MNKTLKELEGLLTKCSELGNSCKEDVKGVVLQVFQNGAVGVTYDLFGDKWTCILYEPRSGTEVTSYGHLMPEQIIVAKVIPILKEILEKNKVSAEEKRLARIATLKAERAKINKELKSLSLPIDGKEVEGE